MRPYGSQNSKTLLLPQITFESFQTFSEFSSRLSSQIKVRFWIFESLSFGFFTIFDIINMGPYGRQNFKTPLLPQITFDFFQSFPESFSLS